MNGWTAGGKEREERKKNAQISSDTHKYTVKHMNTQLYELCTADPTYPQQDKTENTKQVESSRQLLFFLYI